MLQFIFLSCKVCSYFPGRDSAIQLFPSSGWTITPRYSCQCPWGIKRESQSWNFSPKLQPSSGGDHALPCTLSRSGHTVLANLTGQKSEGTQGHWSSKVLLSPPSHLYPTFKLSFSPKGHNLDIHSMLTPVPTPSDPLVAPSCLESYEKTIAPRLFLQTEACPSAHHTGRNKTLSMNASIQKRWGEGHNNHWSLATQKGHWANSAKAPTFQIGTLWLFKYFL